MSHKVSAVVLFLIGSAVIVAAQFSIPVVFGADGYLHIRVAEFLRTYGLRYNFHWARFSVFASNFADKDFLYHVLLVPFTFLPNIFFGVKLSAAIFAILFYLAFWLSLERYCQEKRLIFLFMIAFFCSGAFLHSLGQARNMILTVGLIFAFVHCLIEKKHLVIFLIAAFYALSHVSGPYLLVLALLGELVRYVNEGEFSGGSILAVTAGLGVGFLAHPNFPNNLLIFYLNGILVPVFALKWGLELGAEFFPISTRDFVLGYPLMLAGLILAIACAVSQKRQITTRTQIWLCISAPFFIFSFFSQRYLVYAYPLILIALAGYFSDWWQGAERLIRLRRNKKALVLAGLVAVCVFVVIGYHSHGIFRSKAQGEFEYNRHYEAVGAWMSKNIPAGEVIFHANWSDSQFLIGLNPKDDYFVTLDPIYMYYWSPRAYELYRKISFGNTSNPYALLKRVFGVNYGYASKNYFSGLITQVRSDPRFEVLAEDYMGLIFKLRP